MREIIAESHDDEVDPETQALLDFICYAEAEGFISMEEDEDGEIHLYSEES